MEGLTSVEGGYDRTGSRSPMQWDDGVNAGFSSAPKEKLYIPQDESADRPTVKAQQADPESLYHEVQKLIRIRQENPALQSKGEISFVYAEPDSYPFAYIRSKGTDRILVVLNPSAKETSFTGDYDIKETVYSYGGEISIQGQTITVPAKSAGFYRI